MCKLLNIPIYYSLHEFYVVRLLYPFYYYFEYCFNRKIYAYFLPMEWTVIKKSARYSIKHCSCFSSLFGRDLLFFNFVCTIRISTREEYQVDRSNEYRLDGIFKHEQAWMFIKSKLSKLQVIRHNYNHNKNTYLDKIPVYKLLLKRV